MNNLLTFNKNRRIAFVCFSSSFGGLELSMLKLASECTRRSAECCIIVQPNTMLAQYAAQEHLKTILLKTRLKYGDIGASIQLARILHSHRIDIAVIMQSKDISIVTAAHVLVPTAKLVFYQEMQFGINKRDIFHTWMYSHLSLWITLTQKMKREVTELTHMPPERIAVIPIGTDMRRFNPDLYNRKSARQQFRIPQSKFVIGMLGRLDAQKGQEEFIRAAHLLLQQEADLHFVLAGDETHGQHAFKEHLENLIRELNIQAAAQFLPFTEAVPEFMSALDIFVLPSYSETFGFVLVEAMAMQKTIVATNAGGVPEIITDSSTGILIPPRNFTLLAEALKTLIKNKELRTSLSHQARRDALNRFDITLCIDQLVHTIDIL
jgi:glycosyltransferase involved in cell wall biosynthesis